MWIKRDLSEAVRAGTELIQIFRGPRQCGKTSLVLNLDQGFKELSLDDPNLRKLAQDDPELFLKQFEDQKIFIDEAQYAPNLFPSIKRKIDILKRNNKKSEPIVRLSGSNQILLDKQVKESLAGRASFFDMNTLSVKEILTFKNFPIQEILFKGGWPEIYANEKLNPKKYLDDYISSYIEKDIVLAAGIQKSTEFLKFIQLLAGRSAKILDYSELAKDCGIDAKTSKDWIHILERMGIIALVTPYFSNLSKRLIKAPKMYFIDTGLACRLQGWTSSETILTSPQQGPLFETLVFSEIFKTNINHKNTWKIFHWRTKDKEEVDFLVEFNPKNFVFIEAKVSATNLIDLKKQSEIKKVFGSRIPQLILCHQEGEHILGNNVPIRHLASKLLSLAKE